VYKIDCISYFLIRQDLQDHQEYFSLHHFPDESDETQSACSGVISILHGCEAEY